MKLNHIKISLIIATRNRCEQLRRCLDYVKRLQCKYDWELTIVNNGSSDDTERVVQEFSEQVDFDVKPIYEPRLGLGRSHNAGVANARGEIVAFTDDDCYPDPGFLDQVVRVFEYPEIGYMGGRILLYDSTDAPITIRTSKEVTVIPPGSFIPAGLIQGANMAARRTVIEAIGGFDPMLGPGTPFNCVDVDFVARASAAGFAGGYFPGPVVYHHHGRKQGRVIEDLLDGYAYGRGAYHAKFILNSATRNLYARHWWWRTTWQSRGAFLRELLGAGHYCLARLTHRGALSHYLRAFRLTDTLRRR